MSYTRNEWWEEQAPNLYSCWMDIESKSLHKSWRKWARIPSTRAKNNKNTELNGSSRGRKKGDKRLGLFCPGWSHQRGPKATHLPRLVPPTGTNGLSSRLEPPTETNVWHSVPVSGSNRNKSPLYPHAVRLAFGPGTKALFGPGPKGSRD
jgi:hypothetical protein